MFGSGLKKGCSLALLAAALTGCGGGDDNDRSDAAASGTATALAATAPRYALAGVARSSVTRIGKTTTTATLHVFEPGSKGSPSLSVDLGDITNNVTPLLWSRAYRITRAKRTVRYEGIPKAFYVKQGRIYQIDLRPGQSRRPTRISSMNDACQVAAVFPMSPDGVDAWIKITPPFADGRCPDYNPYPVYANGVMVRTSMTTGQAPVLLSPDYNSSMDDGLRRPGGWLLGLQMYDRNLKKHQPVRGAQGLSGLSLFAYDFANLDGAYVLADDELRRLEWSTASATAKVGPSLHKSPTLGSAGASDLTGLFFTDGDQLFHTDGTRKAHSLASTDERSIVAIRLAGKNVVLVTLSGTSYLHDVVSQSGGTVRPLGGDTLLGVTARAAVFTDRIVDLASRSATPFAISQWGWVQARTRVADRTYLDTVIGCKSAQVNRCDELVETNVATMKSLSIGRFVPPGGLALSREGLGPGEESDTTGVASLITYMMISSDADGTIRNVEDLYRWIPGTSHSLLRLTRSIQ